MYSIFLLSNYKRDKVLDIFTIFILSLPLVKNMRFIFVVAVAVDCICNLMLVVNELVFELVVLVSNLNHRIDLFELKYT